MAALAALGLRQDGIDAFSQRASIVNGGLLMGGKMTQQAQQQDAGQ
jgi:hypothetical protein